METTEPLSSNNPAPPQAGVVISPHTICALAMIGAFFLPWFTALGFNASGYDAQKVGKELLSLWAIPGFALLTALAGFANQSQKGIGQITGTLPFLGLIYAYLKLGADIFNVMAVGSYVTLVLGALLVILPERKTK